MWHPKPDGTLAIKSDSAHAEKGDRDGRYLREASADLPFDRILKLAKCVRGETDRLTRRDMPHPLEKAVQSSGDGKSIAGTSPTGRYSVWQAGWRSMCVPQISRWSITSALAIH